MKDRWERFADLCERISRLDDRSPTFSRSLAESLSVDHCKYKWWMRPNSGSFPPGLLKEWGKRGWLG